MSAQPDDGTILPGSNPNDSRPTVSPASGSIDGTRAPELPADHTRPPTDPPGAKKAGSFGPYQLLGEIARGGMGIVYRALDTRVQHVVALKVILAGDAQAFLREVKTVIQLDHPHALPIRDFGELP
jgi:eukaryotic-like serine/threonine-protein kinase